LFPPTKTLVRSRWRKDYLTGDERASEALRSCPDDIPGMAILLDGGKRRGVIHDPLSKSAYLLQRLAISMGIVEPLGGVGKKIEVTGQEEQTFESLDPSTIKLWLHHMRNAVDLGWATVSSGALPTLEQIAMLPGRTRCEIFNNAPKGRKREFLEDPELISLP
jgi:hypothetical protein